MVGGGDAGVVDEQVDAVVSLGDLCEARCNRPVVAHIAFQGRILGKVETRLGQVYMKTRHPGLSMDLSGPILWSLLKANDLTEMSHP